MAIYYHAFFIYANRTRLCYYHFPGGGAPQADSPPQNGQTYVIQHPVPGTEGPLMIKKEGVEKKKAQAKKLDEETVIVAKKRGSQ